MPCKALSSSTHGHCQITPNRWSFPDGLRMVRKGRSTDVNVLAPTHGMTTVCVGTGHGDTGCMQYLTDDSVRMHTVAKRDQKYSWTESRNALP